MSASVRELCRGAMPLRARLEPWQRGVCADPDALAGLLDRYGSPVNLIDPGPMARNAAELQAQAEERASRFGSTSPARPTRRWLLSTAPRARPRRRRRERARARQALDRGLDPTDLIVTAAVKPAALLQLSARTSTPVAIDNADELAAYAEVAGAAGATVPIAMRLGPAPRPGSPPTRFGLQPDRWRARRARRRRSRRGAGRGRPLPPRRLRARRPGRGDRRGAAADRRAARPRPPGRLSRHRRRDPGQLPRDTGRVGRVLGRAPSRPAGGARAADLRRARAGARRPRR